LFKASCCKVFKTTHDCAIFSGHLINSLAAYNALYCTVDFTDFNRLDAAGRLKLENSIEVAVRCITRSGNLLAHLPDARQAEVVQSLLEHPGSVQVERIVSQGQITPEGTWYDQDHDEWVLLLTGGAELQLADEDDARRLEPGDWLHLPAHCRHRVVWTAPEHETVWLAVHWIQDKEE
jgi:cupin 2 domain-containing protein